MHALVNGIQLAYEEHGSGPAVVLLHDLPYGRQMWQSQVEPLVQRGFRVVLPDLRGLGESSGGENNVSLARYADDVMSLLNYLGIGRAAFVGAGLGGYVLLELLARAPKVAASVTFVDTMSKAADSVEKKGCDELLALIDTGDQLKAAQLWKALYGRGGEFLPWKSVSLAGVRQALQALRDRRDFTVRVRDFRLPALVLGREAVSRHDAFLATALPYGVRYTLVEQDGKGWQETFSEVLLQFLDSIRQVQRAPQLLRQVA